MKKIGTLNTHLSLALSRMGHGDTLVICDCGLPIPRSSEIVDLALTSNIPRFIETLRVILEELEVERAVIAREMERSNKPTFDELMNELKAAKVKRVRKVSHAAFKKQTENGHNTVFVRTGEATPFANVILVSGVTFS